MCVDKCPAGSIKHNGDCLIQCLNEKDESGNCYNRFEMTATPTTKVVTTTTTEFVIRLSIKEESLKVKLENKLVRDVVARYPII